jgi:predicted permease
MRVWMAWIRRLWSALFKRGSEAEFDEEIRSHLEMQIEDNRRLGMGADEARAAALRRFGGVQQIRERARDRRGFPWLESIVQDARYAFRGMRRNPGFAAAATLSLSLGIGANTAIFSLIDQFLLRPLPVKDPERLAMFSIVGQGVRDSVLDYPFIERLNRQSTAFAGVLAVSLGDTMLLGVSGDSRVESVLADQASGNYFRELGVRAAMGRMWTEEEDGPAGAQPVVVISHDFWRRRFGSDPTVVGRKILLNDFPMTVMGVAPSGFSGFEVGRRPDLWWPLGMTPQVYPGRTWLKSRTEWLLTMGRLKPGVSLEQARAEADAIYRARLFETPAERLAGLSPAERSRFFDRSIQLEPGAAGWSPFRKQLKKPLLILMTIVGLTLLIACSNVAHLLLARAAARRKEIALRLSLGAGRFRILRQLLTESMALSLIGGALGLLFAYQGATLLQTYMPPQRPIVIDPNPDLRVLGFTLGVSILTAILFGLAPALGATRHDLTTALKVGGGQGGSKSALNKLLIVAEVALALFLLIGAGLFIRSLQNLKTLDAGFRRENVSVVEVRTAHDVKGPEQQRFYKQFLTRLESLPGVRAASLSNRHPLYAAMTGGSGVRIPGRATQPGEDARCKMFWVGANYFETLGISLLEGRDFLPQEEIPKDPSLRAQDPPAAVINQTMARTFFGNETSVGKVFEIIDGSFKAYPYRIIGVVRDAKYGSLRESTWNAFYTSYFQNPGYGRLTYFLHTAAGQTVTRAVIERAAREIDPRLLVTELRTMENVVDQSLHEERIVAELTGFFSLFALFLTGVGLYGVLSYAVARRTREMGVRMALGAQGADLIRQIMKETLWLTAIGVVIGLAAALASARFVSSFLFELSTGDPVSLLLAVITLFAAACIAGYLPARRASKVDPMIALRSE